MDFKAAWADDANGWRNHMIVCIRVAAHAYAKFVICGDKSISEDNRKLDAYATIRECPNKHLPNRAGLDKITCLAARSTGRYTRVGDQDDDI